MDALEIILEIEEAFDISIPDQVAEKIETVGQLYEYVVRQTRDQKSRPADDVPARTDICLTAAVFYMIRRELCPKLGLDRRQVRPRVVLEDLLPRAGRRRDWAKLERAVGLKSPALVRPRWVVVAASMLCLTVSVAAACRVGEPLILLVTLAASGGVARILTVPLANRFPRWCTTVGDLCYWVLALNYRRLLDQFGRVGTSDVFQTIKTILVEQLQVDPALVTREASLVKDLGMD